MSSKGLLATLLAIHTLVNVCMSAFGDLVKTEQSDILHSDHQTSVYLQKGETKIFYYWSEISNGPLSITVTPCIANLHWFITFSTRNDSYHGFANSNLLYENQGHEMHTWSHPQTPKGLYAVQVTALDRASATHIYVSTEYGGPHALNGKTPRLRIQKKQRNRRLTLKWNQSLVDPHVTHYCLVVSTTRNYSTLCEALGEHYGNTTTALLLQTSRRATKVGRMGRNNGNGKVEDTLLVCVGRRTHYTVSNLEQGRLYYFNLFAVNRQTNLSFPYGSSIVRFDRKVKPIVLKDGKPTRVNLRKMDGKAVFRYKVIERSMPELQFHVTPCGGGVDVEVTLHGECIIQRRRIDGYGRLLVRAPVVGQRYHVRVMASNREELERINSVEILAISRSAVKVPFPAMPSDVHIKDYSAECNAVTVGWLPVTEPRSPVQYCVWAREGHLHEHEGHKMSDQCSLETRLRKSVDFTVKYCQDRKPSKEIQVIVQRISQLKSDTSYVIQVTAQKPHGKALSYDLLQTQTKRSCKNNDSFN